MALFEILFWMAAGASFYHYCPKVAKGTWEWLKSAYKFIVNRVS